MSIRRDRIVAVIILLVKDSRGIYV